MKKNSLEEKTREQKKRNIFIAFFIGIAELFKGSLKWSSIPLLLFSNYLFIFLILRFLNVAFTINEGLFWILFASITLLMLLVFSKWAHRTHQAVVDNIEIFCDSLIDRTEDYMLGFLKIEELSIDWENKTMKSASFLKGSVEIDWSTDFPFLKKHSSELKNYKYYIGQLYEKERFKNNMVKWIYLVLPGDKDVLLKGTERDVIDSSGYLLHAYTVACFWKWIGWILTQPVLFLKSSENIYRPRKYEF